MKKTEKKSCCGCFGAFFKSRTRENPQRVEVYAQIASSGLSNSKLNPDSLPRANSERNFFPKINNFDLPGVPGLRTTIVTGYGLSNSVCNESREVSVRTPIVHNYLNEGEDNPVPLIFENLKKRVSSKGLPILAPVTPARGVRIRSQNTRNVIKSEEQF